MFYGAVVKTGQEVRPKQEGGREILHLSQACLASGGDNGSVFLMLENSKKEKFALCALNSQTMPQAPLDLFFSTDSDDVKLSVKGKGEIHVAGYFEPPEDDMEEDEEDEDEEGLHEQLESGKTIESLLQEKKKKAITKQALGQKKANDKLDIDDDDEDEDEEVGEEDEDEEDDDNSELDLSGINGNEKDDLSTGEDAEEEDSDEDEEEEEPPKTVAQKGKITNTNSKLAQMNKRKQPDTQSHSDQSKKAKVGGDLQKFENDLETFLRKNGRTPLASLGSQIKKPAGVDKLGQFMRERPHKFVVEGGQVSLKS